MKTTDELIDELDELRTIMSSVLRDIRILEAKYLQYRKQHDLICEALYEVPL